MAVAVKRLRTRFAVVQLKDPVLLSLSLSLIGLGLVNLVHVGVT